MSYIVKIDDKEFKLDVRKEGELFHIVLNGNEIPVEAITRENSSKLALIINYRPYDIFLESSKCMSVNGENYDVEIIDVNVLALLEASPQTTSKKETKVTAPMPGLVIEIEVKEGDTVKQGQGLLIVEAMKMQNEMNAPRDGVVKKILMQKGQTVNSGETLLIIE